MGSFHRFLCWGALPLRAQGPSEAWRTLRTEHHRIHQPRGPVFNAANGRASGTSSGSSPTGRRPSRQGGLAISGWDRRHETVDGALASRIHGEAPARLRVPLTWERVGPWEGGTVVQRGFAGALLAAEKHIGWGNWGVTVQGQACGALGRTEGSYGRHPSMDPETMRTGPSGRSPNLLEGLNL